MSQTGVLVIGAGRVARQHLQAIRANSGVRLVGVMDTDPAQLASVNAEYGPDYADTDLEAALGRPGIDGVIIAAPTQVHMELALSALRRGYHVLVEKPMAVNLAEAQAMVGAARAMGRLLVGAQVVRFLPLFQAARQFVASGGLGRPIHFMERRLTYREEVFPWWRGLPYFLISHWGSHSVDLLLWLLGERAAGVFCDGKSEMAGYDGIDDFTLHLRLAGGARATFHQSFSSRLTTHDLVLIGSEATLTFDCYRTVRVNDRLLLSMDESEMLRVGFENQLAAFLAAVRGERPPEAAGQELLPLMSTLDAAVESLKTGQVAVPVTGF